LWTSFPATTSRRFTARRVDVALEAAMADSRTAFFETLKAAGPSRADSMARMETLANLLDGAVVIPGTNQRIGLDALIGLVPGIGDLVSAALSSYIIWEARQLGLPRWKIARMIGNLAVDTAIGAIPVAGDVFDVFFRANKRNMRIVREHMERKHGPSQIDGEATRIDGALR
jgi:hypothetical protein